MKNYFDFTLKGKGLLSVWLPFLLVFGVLYVWLLLQIRTLTIELGVIKQLSFYLIYFSTVAMLVLVVLIFKYFFTVRMINGIVYKNESVQCGLSFSTYMNTALPGLIFSTITLGIYLPWYMRDMQRLFVDYSSFKSYRFSFLGTPGSLFLILFLTLFIPIFLFTIACAMIGDASHGINTILFCELIFMFFLIPYVYLMYKWIVDIQYKNYFIRWDTKFFPTVGRIALQVFFTMLLVGIYYPMACLRLYRYFASRTIAYVDFVPKLRFGYDSDLWDDFFYIWGQAILTIVTCFIYYPWAYCKVAQRILSKTYMEETTTETLGNL